MGRLQSKYTIGDYLAAGIWWVILLGVPGALLLKEIARQDDAPSSAVASSLEGNVPRTKLEGRLLPFDVEHAVNIRNEQARVDLRVASGRPSDWLATAATVAEAAAREVGLCTIVVYGPNSLGLEGNAGEKMTALARVDAGRRGLLGAELNELPIDHNLLEAEVAYGRIWVRMVGDGAEQGEALDRRAAARTRKLLRLPASWQPIENKRGLKEVEHSASGFEIEGPTTSDDVRRVIDCLRSECRLSPAKLAKSQSIATCEIAISIGRAAALQKACPRRLSLNDMYARLAPSVKMNPAAQECARKGASNVAEALGGRSDCSKAAEIVDLGGEPFVDLRGE